LVGHDAVFPVLKSNAYGHGLEEVGKILNDTRAPYLAVDSRPEALRLMKVTNKPFLLLGQTYPANYACMDLRRVTPCVYSLDVIHALLDMQTPVRIHLFLNTGMNREGIQKQELDAIIELIARHPSKHLLTIE
jgi:alanine racemase